MSKVVSRRPIEEDVSFMGRHKRFMMAAPKSWSAQTRLVAIALFAHAHDDGSGIYVGIERLIAMTGLSRSGVMRALKILSDEGILIRDGIKVHPNGAQTTLRRLDLSKLQEVGHNAVPASSTNGTRCSMQGSPTCEGGSSTCGMSGSATCGIQTESINRERTESLCQEAAPLTVSLEKDDPDGFAEFWSVYPTYRHASKKSAIAAFPKAVKRAGGQERLMGALRAQVAIWPKRGDHPRAQSVPMASTWLNKDRWDDPLESIETMFRDRQHAPRMSASDQNLSDLHDEIMGRRR